MKTTYKEGELLEFNEKGETKLFGLNYTEMVYVEKGTFNIGDNSSGREDEKEATITFDNSYFIGKYPVTQEFYEYIKGENPSTFKGKYKPVNFVSWDDICKGEDCFLNQLNAQIKDKYPILTGYFVLPSEAQWEYAARGGRAWEENSFMCSGSNTIEDTGFADTIVVSGKMIIRKMPVGLKQPNVLGLYDMSGNVGEFCQDIHQVDYTEIPKNGKASKKFGSSRTGRGINDIVYRYRLEPSVKYEEFGFRLVFVLP